MKHKLKLLLYRTAYYLCKIHPQILDIRSQIIDKINTQKPCIIFDINFFGKIGTSNYLLKQVLFLQKKYQCIIVIDKIVSNIEPNFDYVLLNLDKIKNKFFKFAARLMIIQAVKPRYINFISWSSAYNFFNFAPNSFYNLNINYFVCFFSKQSFAIFESKTIKKLLEKVHLILSDNQHALDVFANTYPNVHQDKLYCLYNYAADLENFNYTGNNSHLRKLADESILQSDAAAKPEYTRRSHKDSSTAATYPDSSAVEFSMRSNLSSKEKRLLWIGRLDKDKNLELLYQIALHNQEWIFDLYGYQTENNITLIEGLQSLTNVNFCGPCSSLLQINFNIYTGFIFTSFIEGMPNILLEIGLVGLPIIAPNVGGIKELINNNTGILVENNLLSYSTALNELKKKADYIALNSQNLKNLILDRHGKQKYLSNLNFIYSNSDCNSQTCF